MLHGKYTHINNNKLFVFRKSIIYFVLALLSVPVLYCTQYYYFSRTIYSTYYPIRLQLAVLATVIIPFSCILFGYLWKAFSSHFRFLNEHKNIIYTLFLIFFLKYVWNFVWHWDILSIIKIPNLEQIPKFIYDFMCLLCSFLPFILIFGYYKFGSHVWMMKNNNWISEERKILLKTNKINIMSSAIFLFILALIPFVIVDAIDFSKTNAGNVTLNSITEHVEDSSKVLNKDVSLIDEDNFIKHIEPTSVEVIIEKKGNQDAFIEIYKSEDKDPYFSHTVNERSKAVLYVDNTLRISTTKPEEFDIYAAGTKLEFKDDNNTGVYSCNIKFYDYLDKWVERNNKIQLRNW